ncbi:hypothetical protein KKI23_02925 [Patescibacteria group bacterium]|nr:hypothetical protein [Patescibacteria group bacterium]
MTKPIQVIVWIIIFLATAATAYFLTVDNNANNNTNTNVSVDTTYPPAGDHSYYLLNFLIVDSQDGIAVAGQYNTDGLVVDKTYCPPCPEGAFCIPCPPDAIFVAEQVEAETDKQLRIQADNLDQFMIGQHYTFSLSVDEETEEVSLLSYSIF